MLRRGFVLVFSSVLPPRLQTASAFFSHVHKICEFAATAPKRHAVMTCLQAAESDLGRQLYALDAGSGYMQSEIVRTEQLIQQGVERNQDIREYQEQLYALHVTLAEQAIALNEPVERAEDKLGKVRDLQEQLDQLKRSRGSALPNDAKTRWRIAAGYFFVFAACYLVIPIFMPWLAMALPFHPAVRMRGLWRCE